MGVAKKQPNGSVRPWTITPENIADFKRALELLGDGPALPRSLELHRDPVHADEFRAVRDRLDRSFDIPLWIDDLLTIDSWRPPAANDLAEYQRVFDIRQALEEALIQDRPTGPPVSPAAEGMPETWEEFKRASEAPARSRAG